MLFITNRFPKGSIQTVIGRQFEFDLDNNGPSNSVYFCRRSGENDLIEIGSNAFLTDLRRSKYSQILVYIHGFSNLPEDAFRAALELQSLCDKKKHGDILVVPIIWPCDNDLGIVKDYWDDQKSADGSAFAFARTLERFVAWRNSEQENNDEQPCTKRINILAHSMGNRVLRQTLIAWNKYDLSNGVPLLFRNIFLVAADIENESIHRNSPGKLICDASRNVVVYYASDDLALRASKAANLKNKIASRRLGHTGPENPRETPNNVYSIDCDDVNTIYDRLAGHSYFRSGTQKGEPGLVFDHIYQCIFTGRVHVESSELRTLVIKGV